MEEREPTKIEQIIFLLYMPIGIFISGVLIKWAWSLFIVPLGVEAISIPQAIGIDLLITYIMPKSFESKPSIERLLVIITEKILFIVIILILKLFM